MKPQALKEVKSSILTLCSKHMNVIRQLYSSLECG